MTVLDNSRREADAVLEAELPGVTPEMLDWWWVNMEKGYVLWEPKAHKSFAWEVPPQRHTHLGAIQIVEETMGDMSPMRIRIRWDDPRTCPVPIEYSHAVVAAGIVPPKDDIIAYVVHQYEATERGTKLRSTQHFMIEDHPPNAAENWKRHAKGELARFPEFLPDLYRLWQAVNDPDINRFACMKQA